MTVPTQLRVEHGGEVLERQAVEAGIAFTQPAVGVEVALRHRLGGLRFVRCLRQGLGHNNSESFKNSK